MRRTLDWEHLGKTYQVRVEGTHILWLAVWQRRPGPCGHAWRRLNPYGERAKLAAVELHLEASEW